MSRYYVVEGGKHTQLRLWGSLGWFHLELDGRERPLRWQSDHPDAPDGEQIFEWERRDGYRDLTAAAVAFAAGAGAPPITTKESRAALRAVFAGYTAAESGTTQRVASAGDGTIPSRC
jgi:predicted dehydrogenase